MGVQGRLVEFAELMGLAVANLQAREELAASRARLVAAATRSADASGATCTTARSSGSSTRS